MKASIEEQRAQLMETGYVMCRGMIPPDELQRLRQSVDRIVERPPEPESRVDLTEWVDRETADAVEFFLDERTLGFSCQLMDVAEAEPLGTWVLCKSGTGWHRDVHPIDMAPLDGLQEDLRLNGPPYLQWQIALYDDSFLHVIPASHLRRNNDEERKIERRMGVVPLPGQTVVDMKAGDGIVYINNLLHAAEPNGDIKRRTFHMGYQAFDNKGFTHYHADAMGVDFIEHLSPSCAEQCRQFERLHAQRDDQIAATFRAIVDGDGTAFLEAFDTLHPSEHARMTSVIVLSKIAYQIRKYKDSDDDDHNTDAVQTLAARFSAEELDRLQERFAALEVELTADEEQYESLFQNREMKYYFYEMPKNFGIHELIASWGR
jgi:hypothetical protein